MQKINTVTSKSKLTFISRGREKQSAAICTSFLAFHQHYRNKSFFIFFATISLRIIAELQKQCQSNQIRAIISLQGCVRIRPLAMCCIPKLRCDLSLVALSCLRIWIAFEHSSIAVAHLSIASVILCNMIFARKVAL